jgi:hypothetical protein
VTWSERARGSRPRPTARARTPRSGIGTTNELRRRRASLTPTFPFPPRFLPGDRRRERERGVRDSSLPQGGDVLRSHPGGARLMPPFAKATTHPRARRPRARMLTSAFAAGGCSSGPPRRHRARRPERARRHNPKTLNRASLASCFVATGASRPPAIC